MKPPSRDRMRHRCPICGHPITTLARYRFGHRTIDVRVRVAPRSLDHLKRHQPETVQTAYRRRQIARRKSNRR